MAWWLLEQGLTARQRVCRMQLLRRNSAREYARSVHEVGDDPAVAGNETVAGIEAECLDLGLAAFTQKGDELEDEKRLGYTGGRRSSPRSSVTGCVQYLLGRGARRTRRDLAPVRPDRRDIPGRQPIYGPVVNPAAWFAAADGALKSMMGPIERIALLFGWTVPGRAEEVSATIDYMNSEMSRLRP